MNVDSDMAEALRRLQRSGKRTVPFVRQMEAADCGPACLAMVLAYHGKHVPLEEVRRCAGTDRGADAVSLIDAASAFGLRGRGLRVELAALEYLPPASVLHWGFNHFVVLERRRRTSVDIVDPAYGRRRVPIDRFGRHFTGIALVFERRESFELTPPGRSKSWRYLIQLFAHPALVTRILVASLMLRALALVLPMITGMVVDRIVPRGDRDLLWVIGIAVGAVLLFHVFASLLRSYLFIELRTRLDARLTLGFLSHMVALPFTYFLRRSTGDLIMRVQANTHIRELLTSSLLSTLLDGGFAFAYLILIFILSPLLGLLCIAIATLQTLVLVIARSRYRELTSRDLESQARAQSWLSQMLVGIETLKVSGAEERAVGHWANLYVDELNVAVQRGRMVALVDAANGLLQAGAPLLLLAVGAALVMDGHLTLGAMLATTSLAIGFLSPISSLIQSTLQLQMLGSYVERIEDVLATAPEQKSDAVTAPPRLNGAIELSHVSFRYGASDPLVIRDVSLSIKAGSAVAIVGRSGCGKSTLAALILGLHPPTEGRITYDGHDLAGIDHRLLRQQLGVVPQHAFLLSGSIKSNIALADPSVPPQRVIAAAARACVDADIRAMVMGYDTIVSDGGGSLSGGQRQRIAIARALVNDPAVLLLDEATSSLDASTERAVSESLRSLGITRIIIAHRLSTIIDADEIVVLEDGRVVETGTHNQLIATGGAYSALVADQAFAGVEGR